MQSSKLWTKLGSGDIDSRCMLQYRFQLHKIVHSRIWIDNPITKDIFLDPWWPWPLPFFERTVSDRSMNQRATSPDCHSFACTEDISIAFKVTKFALQVLSVSLSQSEYFMRISERNLKEPCPSLQSVVFVPSTPSKHASCCPACITPRNITLEPGQWYVETWFKQA